MSTMDMLKDVKYTRTELEMMQERLSRIRSAAYGSRQEGQPSGMVSGSHDTLAVRVSIIADLETRILTRIVDLETAVMDAEDLIAQLPSAQREIMRLRYLEGHSWTEVAATKNYSRSRCMQLHESAIKNLGGR